MLHYCYLLYANTVGEKCSANPEWLHIIVVNGVGWKSGE